MRTSVQLSASLLAADPAALGAEAARAQSAGVDRLHLDVMDGHYAPNLALAPQLIVALQRHTSLPIDVHLEVETPDTILGAIAFTGADTIIVQYDTLPRPSDTFREIRRRRASVGLAMNRGVTLDAVKSLLGEIDLLVLMAVDPGFGGQSLDPEVYAGLVEASQARDECGRAFEMAVDGGVTTDNADRLIALGADQLITGTTIFGAVDMQAVVRSLRGMHQPSQSVRVD